MQDRACFTQVCSTCCFSAEGTDAGSVSCDDAVRSLCPDHKPDALSCILEEFYGEGGEFEPETQTDQTSSATISQLGIDIVDGEMPDSTIVVGSAAANLDTINELIQTDHHYYKEEPNITVASSVASIPTNIVNTSLLSSSKVLPSLAPTGLEGLKAKLALPSGQVVVVNSLAQSPVTTTSSATAGWNRMHTGSHSLSSSSKAALATMVDPNVVYAPRPVEAEPDSIDTLPEMEDGFLSDAEIMKSLEGLLSIDGFADQLQTQQQQQQQAVITADTPAPATTTATVKSRDRKRKLNSSVTNTVSPPVVHSQDLSRVTFGLDSEGNSEEEYQNGNLSPDSGYLSSPGNASSPESDRSSSPERDDIVSLMDEANWQQDPCFLDLFPEFQL